MNDIEEEIWEDEGLAEETGQDNVSMELDKVVTFMSKGKGECSAPPKLKTPLALKGNLSNDEESPKTKKE